MDEDFYDLLEVPSNATFQEIDTAYHRLVTALRPDSLALYSLVSEQEVVRLRGRLDVAYRTLGDPDRRTAYDTTRRDDSDGASSDYAEVWIPEDPSDSNLTMGHLQESQASLSAPRQSHSGATSSSDDRSQSHPPAPAQAPAPRHPVPAKRSGGMRRKLVPTVDLPDFTSETELSGAFFKHVRESTGASVDEIANISKISKRYIKAIEANDFAALPAKVYVRGFIMEYARIFGLDPQEIASSYMRLYERYHNQGG